MGPLWVLYTQMFCTAQIDRTAHRLSSLFYRPLYMFHFYTRGTLWSPSMRLSSDRLPPFRTCCMYRYRQKIPGFQIGSRVLSAPYGGRSQIGVERSSVYFFHPQF